MPSRFAERLSPRDQRAVRLGLAAAAGIVALAAVLAWAPRVSEREAAIALESREIARLRGLAEAGPRLGDALQQRRARAGRLPVAAESPTLAVSAVQDLVRQLAEQSQLSVVQVDAPPGEDSLVVVTLVATGDIWGLGEWLAAVDASPVALGVHALTVEAMPGQRTVGGDERLQITVRVSAPLGPASPSLVPVGVP